MKETLDPTSVKSLSRLFVHTSRMHRKVCHHQFNELGLTEGKPKVLEYLKLHNGCSQKDLAKHCHIQPATATSLLGHLEKSGLIYREVNQQDRRITNVFLTEAGIETQKQVEKIFHEIDTCLFSDFTIEEREEVFGYLMRMYQNLKERER
ncbi:MAG: MarR family transcriptional regulator [Turicibacter sp.]|nr:MarR family transcriptional regulator [Turicibacter sp.]